MHTILIATSNPGKLRELRTCCKSLEKRGYSVQSLEDVPHIPAPEETGITFSENARLKARYYAEKTGCATIADDGGIMIAALDGAPGVRSRRWPGYEATDEELIAYTLEQMKHVPRGKRDATITTTICFYDPETETFLEKTAAIDGHLAREISPRAIPGYPYRSLFIVTRYNKYYDELSSEQHDAINHRMHACNRLVEKIRNHYEHQ